MIIHLDNAASVHALFSAHQYDRVLIDSVLAGHVGSVIADDKDSPSVARLDSGAFTLLGGDPYAPACMEIIRCAPIHFVTPENALWQSVLQQAFAERYALLPFVEYKSAPANITHLDALIATIPAGYALQAIDASLAARVPDEIGNPYFYENFADISDFLRRGLGYCMVHEGKIVSAATSMAASATAIDIEIETRESYRRNGLGTLVGARLTLECLRRSIDPKWIAANQDSERLAQKLGFQRVGAYTTLSIEND